MSERVVSEPAADLLLAGVRARRARATEERGSTVAGPPEGRRLVRREMELHLKGYSLDRIRETCLGEQLVPQT